MKTSSFLGPSITANYRPGLVGASSRSYDHRGILTWGDIEDMKRDPQVAFGLRILYAPLPQVKWKVKAKDPAVAKYVDRTLKRLWTNHLHDLLDFVCYGHSGGEVVWKHDEEMDTIEFDRLDPVMPPDLRPLQIGRDLAGITVQGVDQGDGGPGWIRPPRSLWAIHEQTPGTLYGRSRLRAVWIPWQEKTARHGALDVRRLWFVKNVFRGGIIRHPAGTIETAPGVWQSCQDYARELVEKMEAGGVLTLPNLVDEHGNQLWTYEEPKVNGDLTGVREYTGDLDTEILTALGIPPEVVKAADTGSGWSGRSVPFLVWLSSEDIIAASIIKAAVEQICRPGVAVNYGEQWFEVEPVSLVPKQMTEDAAKTGDADGDQGNDQTPPDTQPPAPPPAAPPAPPPVSMSLDAPVQLAQKDGKDDKAKAAGDWEPYTGKMGARKGQSGWKNKTSGRVVWGEKPPAEKKPAAKPGAKVGKVAAKKPVGKVTLDIAKQKIAELAAGATSADDLAAHLAELHMTDLQTLKKELKLKVGGTKAEQAKAAARAAIAAVKGAGPAKPEKPTPKPEPEKPIKPPEKAVKPPPPVKGGDEDEGGLDLGNLGGQKPPEKVEPAKAAGKEPEKAAGQKQGPRPPEPGFTGWDSLGRRWENGELKPGEEEPLKGRDAPVFDPDRKFDAKKVTGADPSDVAEHRADMDTVDALWSSGSYNDHDYNRNKPAFDRLIAAGIMERDRYGGVSPTAKGVATMLATYLPGGGDPKTIAGAKALSQAYRLLKNKGDRQGMLDMAVQYGVQRGKYDAPNEPPNEYSFEDQMRSLAGSSVNPPMGQRLREAAKGMTADLESLSWLGQGAGHAASADDLRKRRKEISQELGALGTSTSSVDWAILGAKRQLAFKGTKNKGALREKLAGMERLKGELDANTRDLEKAAQAGNDTLTERSSTVATERMQKVSEVLRKRVKDPAPVVVKRGEGVGDRAANTMGQAAELLQGCIGRLNAPMSELSTYRDPGNNRAHADLQTRKINVPDERVAMPIRVAIHEICHHLESDPEVRGAALEFLKHRVGDEPFKSLNDVSDDKRFDENERGRKDQFDRVWDTTHAYYVGKDYGQAATEILSMGLDRLFTDPDTLAAKDPEYTAFLLGILDGSIRQKRVPTE